VADKHPVLGSTVARSHLLFDDLGPLLVLFLLSAVFLQHHGVSPFMPEATIFLAVLGAIRAGAAKREATRVSRASILVILLLVFIDFRYNEPKRVNPATAPTIALSIILPPPGSKYPCASGT